MRPPPPSFTDTVLIITAPRKIAKAELLLSKSPDTAVFLKHHD